VAGTLATGTLAMATPAWSQTYVGVTPPTVAPERSVLPEAPPAPANLGSRVAVTGADIAEMVAIGAFGMSAGALVVRMTRRREEPLVA
jgi:hypothetical protein